MRLASWKYIFRQRGNLLCARVISAVSGVDNIGVANEAGMSSGYRRSRENCAQWQ